MKLDRREFISYAQEQKRASEALLWHLPLLLVVSIFAKVGLEWAGYKDGYFMILVGLFLGYVPAKVWKGWKNRHLSRCPSCSRPTWHQRNRPVIVATGRCGYCGEMVLSD